MTRILLINPNTSPAMTAAVRDMAASCAPQGIEIAAVTATFGFPVIATRMSYAVGAYAALEAFSAADGRHDAVILACFGDPGLEALRELAPVPVVGFAEASFRAAQRKRKPFAIVTIGAAWVSMLEERVAASRATSGFVGVFALEGTGLDALGGADAVLPGLETLVRQAVAAGARTVVLGGAALTGLAPRLPAEADYIDPVQAAMAEACALAGPSWPQPVSQPGFATGLTPKLQERLASSRDK